MSKHNKIKRIVITGAPRSGTSAIKRLLGCNSGTVLTPCIYAVNGIVKFEVKLSPESIKVWKATKWILAEYLACLTKKLGDSTHFVLIYRYPLDCYHSLLELNKFRKEKTHPWVDYKTIEAYYSWYKQVHQIAIPLLRRVNSTFVSYEDFCYNPLVYKKLILAKVGLCSDNRNYYDTTEKFLEDEKCLGLNQIVTDSVFRFGSDRKSDQIYNEIKKITQ